MASDLAHKQVTLQAVARIFVEVPLSQKELNLMIPQNFQ